MRTTDGRKRRAVIATLAALPMSKRMQADGVNRIDDGHASQSHPANSRVLVAFFSRSGNTRVVAGLLQRAFSADVFEIRPTNPYPDEYLATVEQARQERDSGYEPPLATRIAKLDLYDTLYLGFPIWGETTPPVIRSFLANHRLGGKLLNPFITHGGYGLGNSLSVLTRHAPQARIGRPFVMQADRERQTMNRFNEWLLSKQR